VSLTINGSPFDPPSADGETRTESRDRHQRIADAVRDELLSWSPREFISAFRRWHHGSFSLIHLNVLTMLETEGPDSMSRLAEALDVSVASMTGIVDRMERRGLVERRHEGKDRRVVLVYPTQAGLEVFREIDERRRVALGRLLEKLTVDELNGLLAGHRALREARTAAALASAAASPSAPGFDAPDSAATTPPRLHRASTTARDDPTLPPLTGAGR
jgi:DNA-binding MarR family transcriptional regulator